MAPFPTALLVSPDDAVTHRVLDALTDANVHVIHVSSFAAARERLADDPDLLISEVRLREHNGLHLALWAQAVGIPAIVMGHADPVTEREAASVGAAYLASEWEPEHLFDAVHAAALLARPAAFDSSSTHAA